MFNGKMLESLEESVARATVRPKELQWQALIHHDGLTYNCHWRSTAIVRLYSDGQSAVVLLTEPKDNEGCSVSDCYARIASKLRTAATQFIPFSNFPNKVVWMQQHEQRPLEVDLVTLLWDGRSALYDPRWHRLTEATSRMYGVGWEELCRVPKL